MVPNVNNLHNPLAIDATSRPMCASRSSKSRERRRSCQQPCTSRRTTAGCSERKTGGILQDPSLVRCSDSPTPDVDIALDIATFTHAKPPRSKWIPSQQSWGVCSLTPQVKAAMRGTLAGQDYALVLHPVPGDLRQTMSPILDGHGEDGEMFSVHAGESLSRQLETAWPQVRAGCYAFRSSEDRTTIETVAKEIFKRTEQYLYRELHSYSGGTTATVVLIVDGEIVVSFNVGDSPAILAFDDGRPHVVLSESHSADSAEEYVRYRARCAQDGVTPSEFVYNRFNCPGGHRLPGPDNNYTPIPIFELDAATNSAVPFKKHCEYIGSLGHHGGIQTVRKHVVRNANDEIIATQPEMIHQNWGSTVAGRPQNTRMFGDFEEKQVLHLDAEPSVSITEIDRCTGAHWVIVASDGITDAHWFEEMTDNIAARAKAAPCTTAQSLCEALVLDTIENAKKAAFAFKNDLPAWDDLSLTLIMLPPRLEAKTPVPRRSIATSPYSAAAELMQTEDEQEPITSNGHGPMRRRTRCSTAGSIEVEPVYEPAFGSAGGTPDVVCVG